MPVPRSRPAGNWSASSLLSDLRMETPPATTSRHRTPGMGGDMRIASSKQARRYVHEWRAWP